MDINKSYRNFIYSQQVNEGLRVTAGILIPALLMAYFGQLQMGVVLALGAMCTSITDSPGPIHHRKNGMIASIAAVFLVSLLSSFAAVSPLLVGLVVVVCSFFFSMLAIYGARAGAVGIAALIIMVLDMQQQRQGVQVLWHALLLASGGLWYMCLSMLLHNVMPYKSAQQGLGDCIQSIATYLRIRADFYKKEVNYDTTYRRLIQQQGIIQEKQTALNELLFKTRDIVKESTPTGRVLVMIFMDVSDMFERIMTSYQHYATLHNYFDGLDILEHYSAMAYKLANQLELIGIAVKSGSPFIDEGEALLEQHLDDTGKHLDALRETHLTNDNLEGFMSLRRILENLRDINDRLKTLQQYTTYDPTLTKKKSSIDYSQYITHQEISSELFASNLTLQSEIFRHSLRLSITMLIGYLASLFFPVGHGYWILLTIVVILKPAYSLSKSRNKDRLFGTLLGVIIGMAILYFIDDRTALLIIMVLLMIGTYTFIRTQYLTSVIMMTPYIIIFFHLLNPNEFRTILSDRLIDTAIGSVIAFLSSILLFPAWERHKIKPLMIALVAQAKQYFDIITQTLVDTGDTHRQKLARKDAFIALANLSDAFNRMMAEPKRKQQGIKDIHQFVVLCHMLLSHVATLSLLAQKSAGAYNAGRYMLVVNDIRQLLTLIEEALSGEENTSEGPGKENLRALNQQVNLLLKQRQEELKESFKDTTIKQQLIEVKSLADQLNFIFNLGTDLAKTAKTVTAMV